jgi:hypothetical protein
VSLGSASPATYESNQRRAATQDGESYLSQTILIGIFLAIFLFQFVANFSQIMRIGRREAVDTRPNIEEQPEPPRAPQWPQDDDEREVHAQTADTE